MEWTEFFFSGEGMTTKFIGRALMLTAALAFLGCKSNTTSTNIDLPVVDTPTDPDVPTPGVIDSTGGFNIKVKPPTGTNYYIHQEGDFTKKCVIDKSATTLADRDLTCTIEVEELEGAFHGIDMVLNAPPDMCEYVEYYPYFYFGYNYGSGPANVAMNYDIAGNLASAIFTDGSGNPTTGAHINTQGNLVCDFDYTGNSPAGPNCCDGTYGITVTKNFGSTDPVGFPISSTHTDNVPWGGKRAACATGAAMSTVQLDTLTGLPRPTIYFSPDGFSQTFSVPSTISLTDLSLYWANYFTGAPPTPMKVGGSPAGNPYYQWLCLDDAYEVTARIRIMIREWNEIKEFAKGASGNPDTTGPDPLFGFDVNDLYDWADMGNAYTGIPTAH